MYFVGEKGTITPVVDVHAVIAYEIREDENGCTIIAKTFRHDLDYVVKKTKTVDEALSWIKSLEKQADTIGSRHKVIEDV